MRQIKVIYSYVSIALLCTVLQACSQHIEQNSIDISQYDTNTQRIYRQWQQDVTGCLGRRTVQDGYELVEKFELDNALQDYVFAVLGEPNHIEIDSAFVDNSEGKFITMTYYCKSRCGTVNGEYQVLPVSWLTVILSYKNLSYTENRVVKIMSGIE